MFVKKRSGNVVAFDLKKLKRALSMAFVETTDVVPDLVPLMNNICLGLQGNTVTVEQVQDACEKELMSSGHTDVAKAFILYREHRTRARNIREKPNPFALPDYIAICKYAKDINNRKETWSENCDRVQDMFVTDFPEHEDKIVKTMSLVRSRFIVPSMRCMQFAGPAIWQNNARMYNCGASPCDRWEFFDEAFHLLLAGCGCGFSVQLCHVDALPIVGTVDTRRVTHHTVDDSITGWSLAVRDLFRSYTRGECVEFNYSNIRPEGSKLVTSGGIAPGHLPLKGAIEKIRVILDSSMGRKLRPIQCHDIMCHLAEAVLSGGIRRASLISLFSPNDTEMLYCKAKGNFRPAYGDDPGLNGQREMANNSAVLLRDCDDAACVDDFRRVIDIANSNMGDPGFYFTDCVDYIPNPCAEIGMYPKTDDGVSGWSFCNLTEINGAKCHSEDEFYELCRAASFLGTLQATYTDFEYLTKETKEIVERDRLLGVSISGIMDNPELFLEQSDVLREGAKCVRATNYSWSDILEINVAARLTTVKPSGTASLVLGCIGSGIHAHHSKRYFRRVTANRNEGPAKYFRAANPHMVEEKPNGDWSIIFPVQTREDALTKDSFSAIEFCKHVHHVYNNWVYPGTVVDDIDLTHNVSCTVTLKDNEYNEVCDWIWENRMSIGAMSFVPSLLDTLFPFAPLKSVNGPVDEARWNELCKNYTVVDWSQYRNSVDDLVVNKTLEPACAGGACEV